MKLYEYAAKKIFSSHSIPVPKGSPVTNEDEALETAKKLGKAVIKAQVLVGGRGKAGGIAVATSAEEAKKAAQRILGMAIKGEPVRKLLVEEYKKPDEEMYLGITIDRRARCPVVVASTEGGMDIEEVAKRSPERVSRVHVNPLMGLHDYQARRLAYTLDKKNTDQVADVIKKLYSVFTGYDCTLAEINPLASTSDGIFALDAKIIIDDNALFRQRIEAEELSTLEEIARKSGMSYVALEGDIGCIINGAGLAMATLDIIKSCGGEPANFMDVRAGASSEQVTTALSIVSSNRNVKVVLVNIFGGLTKCDEVARGIIDAGIKIPLVVRLAGTNEEEGRKMLEQYGVTLASSTEDAAKAVVELVHSRR